MGRGGWGNRRLARRRRNDGRRLIETLALNNRVDR